MRRRHRQAVRAGVAGILTAAMVLGLFTPAAAQTPVVVDREALADRLFASIMHMRLTEPQLIGHLVASAEFLNWRQRNPNGDPDHSLVDVLFERSNVAFFAALDRKDDPPSQDRVLNAVEAILTEPLFTSPSTAATAPHIRALTGAVLGRTVGPLNAREQLAEGALRTVQWLRAKDEIQTVIWADVRRTALRDPGFASAWNGAIGHGFNVDVTASLDALKADPELRALIDTDRILERASSDTEFLAEANRQVTALQATLNQNEDEARRKVTDQLTKCPATPGATPACTSGNNTVTSEWRKNLQERIKDINAAVAGASKLVEAADSQTGKAILGVTTAVVTVLDSIAKYAEAVSGRNVTGAALTTATLALTGNYIGAAMSLISVFGGGNPNQAILDKIAELKTEMQNFRTEVDANFEIVKTKLDEIFDQGLAAFNRLNSSIAGNTAALAALQADIAQFGFRMEEVAASVLQAIGSSTLHDAKLAINTYVGYEETTGRPIPTFDEYFTQAESEFHLVATQLASDPDVFVVPAAQADNPSTDPVSVLDTRGEAASINYLAQLGRRRGASLPAGDVGNPAVWSLGANAHTLLDLQNPGYAAQLNPARAAAVAQAGQDIVNLARSLGQPIAPDPTGDRTNQIFKSLLADYRAGVTSLSTALRNLRLDEIQTRWEPQGPSGIQQKVRKTYDLFNINTPAGTPPADPAELAPCTGGDENKIARPTNVSFSRLTPATVRAYYSFTPQFEEPPAGVRMIPDVAQCYSVYWKDLRTVVNGNWRDYYAKLTVNIPTRIQFSGDQRWMDALTASYSWPEEHVFRECATCLTTSSTLGNPTGALIARWPTDRALFARDAVVNTHSNVDGTAAFGLLVMMSRRQQKMYELVTQQVRSAGTPLSLAAKKMNTALRLLQAYTRLGMPVALETDDVLSGLLFGQYQLPADLNSSDRVISTTYQIAEGNYRSSGGSATPVPLRNQPHLSVPCDVSGVSGLPGDPLGDCVIASAAKRADALKARYKALSLKQSEGRYTEELRWVNNSVRSLRIVDLLTRAAP